MDRVELGNSGIKVSRIGLGMWQAGGKNWGKDVNDRDCVAAMVRAQERGVNLIDTAEVYGEEIEAEVLPYCRQERITVLAWSPLAQGVLADTYRVGRVPRDSIRKQNDLFSPKNLREAGKLLRALRKVAKAHRRNVAQVALNALSKDPIVVPIPGAKRPSQAEENAAAVSFDLTPAERRAIEAAAQSTRVETF